MRKRHSGILLGRRSRSWINKDIETVFSVFHAMEPYIIVGSLLADFFQENLKCVKPGQPVEVALNLYTGQIFTAKVEAVWKASGVGQMLPSGTLPGFEPVPPGQPQRQYAAKILFDSASSRSSRSVRRVRRRFTPMG